MHEVGARSEETVERIEYEFLGHCPLLMSLFASEFFSMDEFAPGVVHPPRAPLDGNATFAVVGEKPRQRSGDPEPQFATSSSEEGLEGDHEIHERIFGACPLSKR
jgi:hypothetical protein